MLVDRDRRYFGVHGPLSGVSRHECGRLSGKNRPVNLTPNAFSEGHGAGAFDKLMRAAMLPCVWRGESTVGHSAVTQVHFQMCMHILCCT